MEELDEIMIGQIGELMQKGDIPRVFLRVQYKKRSKEVELTPDTDGEVFRIAVESMIQFLEEPKTRQE